MNTSRKNIDMLSGNLLRSIFRYTVPIILTGLLQLFFNAADLIVVGQFCGSLSVGAVGATGSITGLIVNFFIGLSVGTGVTVAHSLGAGDSEKVHKTVHTAIPTAIISGAIITVIGLAFSEPLLKMMNTPDTVLPLSAKYMKIYFGGIIFMMLYNFAASILRAAGDTKSPLIFLSVAGVINVILNFIFVVFFHLDVAGVAIATTVSQAVSAILVTVTLIRRTDACKLHLRKMKIYKEQFVRILAIGMPAGIQSALFSISNVIIQSSINSFGDILMSGNAAAANIEAFVFVILNAFHQTALNFIGQNLGANQIDRIKKILYSCLGLVSVIGLISTTALYLLGPKLLTFYIPDSPEALQWGMIRIATLFLPYTIMGLMDVMTGALRGMGVSFAPMIISVLGICGIRILWIYTIFRIPEYHTPQCLYTSYTISWIITFCIQLVAFFIVYRKKKKASTSPKAA